MKPRNQSIKTLFLVMVMSGYMSQAYAEDSNTIQTMKILWQKEVTADVNLDCSLGPVAFDKTNKTLLITGTSFRPRVYSDGKFWLMEVGANNGSIVNNTTIKEVKENKAALMLASSLMRGMIVSENSDVTFVGKFESSAQLIMKLNRNENISKFIEFDSKNNARKDLSVIHGAINLQNGNFLLIGGDGKADGIVLKIDSEGNRLWGKSYKIGQRQVDLCTDGLSVAGEEEFLIAGCSTNVKGKFPEKTSDDFILLCNAQGDIIAKDIFAGNPGEYPQICRIEGGTFIGVYGRGALFEHSDINIRAYSPDLKLLWEKQVVESKENKPSSFKISAIPQNGFVLAVNMDFGDIRVFEYDEEGNQVASFSMNRAIKAVNIGLACTDDAAFVVFQTRLGDEKGEELSRIKIIALELK